MYRTIKTEAQIFVTLLLATGVLVFISLSIGVGPQTEAPIDEPSGPEEVVLNEAGVQATGPFYFPIVHKNPTPTPEPFDYFTNFDDSGADDWDTGTSGDCRYFFQNGTYKIRSDDKANCFAFPDDSDTEIKYGEVEAVLQHNEGSRQFDTGIYMNGRGGGEYYLFNVEIDENDSCDWEFTRRYDDDSELERSGDCTKGYTLERRLKMTHASDGTLRFYINGSEVGNFKDSSQLNRGEGVGLYVRTNTEDATTIKFLSFGVKGY
ncbi:MAG TPA: hypothetical protein PKE64_14605 [Anaerolineae bacterium]|nr:hypothetical protein [Anaerolineae bacterium]HMR65234.1 hypothetical protein [Anaerolineae bacterium]